MSQSPSPSATSGEILAYDAAWSALTMLIRSGRPFSGEERNCAFLNLGPDSPAFANISSAAELDFIDDGRGLALCDWDFDGDLDLWMTNRTGPRVRFVRNDFSANAPQPPNWIAFALRGTTANRDGIGARLELELADGTKRIKSLYAGHGHLSQSTKWVHFGLGQDGQPAAVTVRWPGGNPERYAGLESGRRYRLEQGSAQPTAVPPPSEPVDLASSTPEAPPISDGGRIVLLRPSPIPKLTAVDLAGAPIDLSTPSGRPRLLNLWATWCAPCVAELGEWTSEREAIERAGLDIVSLSVDEPGDASDEAFRAGLAGFLDNLDFPFRAGIPTGPTLERLDAVQLSFIGRQRDLPVPSSFLFDGRGRLAVIYRGPVSADQLMKDLEILDAPKDAILAAAIPFDGSWIASPAPTLTPRIAAKIMHQGRFEETVAFVDHVFALAEHDRDIVSDSERAELDLLRGAASFDLKRYEDALASWERLLQANPDNRQVLLETARTHTALDRPDAAIPHLEKALTLMPNDAEHLYYLGQLQAKAEKPAEAIDSFRRSLALRPTPALCFELASTLAGEGRTAEAAASLRQALELQPGWPPAANNLAWILATAPSPNLRDGTEAVRLATIACEGSAYEFPSAIATLAAAHAESGDFKRAIDTALTGIEAADQRDDRVTRSSLERQLAAYREGRPYRDPGLGPQPPDSSP